MGDLNARQAAFVREYLVDLNATQAAIRAGYSEKTAYSQGQRLLKHVEVAKAVAAAKADRCERTEVTQEYVLANLVEVVERCMQRAPVMVGQGQARHHARDAEGRHLWTFDARGTVSALALLAKHTGGFNERVEVAGADGGPIEIAVTRKVVHAGNRIVEHVNGTNGNGARS